MRINVTFLQCVALAGVLSLVGCKSLQIDDQGLVNLDKDGADQWAFRCETADDCLSGYKCLKSVGDDFSVCTATGAGMACEQFNLDGDLYLADDPSLPEGCFGLRGDCDDTDASVHPGADEICDGKDNNCNGEIDEGLESVLCAKQVGVCKGATTACVEGDLESCANPINGANESIYEQHASSNGEVYSATELCDGVDNNCDGTVDEGCCSMAYPLSSSQNNKRGPAQNQACNCVEGQAFECGTGAGTCTRGIRFCSSPDVPAIDQPCLQVELDSAPVACDPETFDPANHADGKFCVTEHIGVMEDLHDNCQHSNDPGCTRTVVRTLTDKAGLQTCSSDTDCSGARETCAFDGVCRKTVVTPTKEVCNGMDDDCDGLVDNHFGKASNAACGACPFNSMKVEIKKQNGKAGFVCVDIYEASRPDATDADAGSDTSHSVSQADVIPWTGVNAAEAASACGAIELREAVGGNVDSENRKYVVPVRALCDPDIWAQACSGKKRESTGQNWTNMPIYPYVDGTDQADYQTVCNDKQAANGALVPTGSQTDCQWTTDNHPGVSKNIFTCTNPDGCTDGNGAIQSPFDMLGNALEWTARDTAIDLDDPGNSKTFGIFLMGGSYEESGKTMTCHPDTGYNNPVAAASKWHMLVRTDDGNKTCTDGSDCASGTCVAYGSSSSKHCAVSCTSDVDCHGRGQCKSAGGGDKVCVMPDPTTENAYDNYQDVGFRCCANPLR